MFVFDWTISLGNVLTVVGFAGSSIAFIMIDYYEKLIQTHEDAIDRLTARPHGVGTTQQAE